MIFDILEEWLNTGLREFICYNSHSHDFKLSFILFWIDLLSFMLTFNPVLALDSTFGLD